MHSCDDGKHFVLCDPNLHSLELLGLSFRPSQFVFGT